MSETTQHVSSRREFLQNTGRLAAATTLAGLAIPRVHAAEDNTIQVVLIGCGGRGTGAAANAMAVKQVPMKLVAMADVFDSRLENSYNNLKKQFPEQVDVPKERQFIGFDAYQKAMDCLKPGDIAIFATPLSVPLGTLRLCHRQGAQCLYGETAYGGWPDVAPYAPAGSGCDRQEFEGGCWFDVPSQSCLATTACPNSRRCDR